MSDTPTTPAATNPTPPDAGTPPVGTAVAANMKKPENRFVVYDLATKQVEQCVCILPRPFPTTRSSVCRCIHNLYRTITLDGETTSVKISHDSRFALINAASEAGSVSIE